MKVNQRRQLQNMTQIDSAAQTFLLTRYLRFWNQLISGARLGLPAIKMETIQQDNGHRRIGESPPRIPLVGVASRIHDVASVCGKTAEELTLLPLIAHRYGRDLKSGHLKREFWPICGENTDKPNNPINQKDSTQPRMI